MLINTHVFTHLSAVLALSNRIKPQTDPLFIFSLACYVNEIRRLNLSCQSYTQANMAGSTQTASHIGHGTWHTSNHITIICLRIQDHFRFRHKLLSYLLIRRKSRLLLEVEELALETLGIQ